MKRLLIHGPRQAAIEDVNTPACPPDGVLVKARLTAVSTGTELRVFRAIPVDSEGRFLHERVPFQLPAENGYSMVGEIVELGEKTRGWEVGQRVFASAPHCEIAALSPNQITLLPENVSDEHAVFLNILEVSHRAVRQANLVGGENVAIVGLGVIGLSALAYCRAFGCRTAAIDLSEERRSIAAQMGALFAASPEDEHFGSRLISFFNEEGADVVFEAASNWKAIRTAMEISRKDGRIVVIARHTQTPDFNPVGHPFLGKRLNLMTTYGYPPDGHRWDARRSVALTLDMLSRRTLDMSAMISHRFSCQELPEVYSRLDQGDAKILGAVISWG